MKGEVPMRDPYEVLEVSKGASDEEIRSAYRRLVRRVSKRRSLLQSRVSLSKTSVYASKRFAPGLVLPKHLLGKGALRLGLGGRPGRPASVWAP